MFGGAANPYDETISQYYHQHQLQSVCSGHRYADNHSVKATDENLASEDWALNIEVCDKVSGDGTTG